MKIPSIAEIPPLSEEDKQTLKALKGSELFWVFCKILGDNYRTACEQMTRAENTELGNFQGTARALTTVYNTIMHHASAYDPRPEGSSHITVKEAEEQIKSQNELQIFKNTRNFKGRHPIKEA